MEGLANRKFDLPARVLGITRSAGGHQNLLIESSIWKYWQQLTYVSFEYVRGLVLPDEINKVMEWGVDVRFQPHDRFLQATQSNFWVFGLDQYVNNRLIPVDLLSNLMPVPCIGNQIRAGFWYDSLSRLSREAGPKNRRHDALQVIGCWQSLTLKWVPVVYGSRRYVC